LGNNYDFNNGKVSIVNFNLERLFEAMENVGFNINKSLLTMEETEMQQLGHCFFAAHEPIDELNVNGLNVNGLNGAYIESQNQTTTNENTQNTDDDLPF